MLDTDSDPPPGSPAEAQERFVPIPDPRHVQIQIDVEDRGNGAAVVFLAGRLMLGPEGAQLETVVKGLIAQGVRRFVFDFSGLTHIDSTGIGRCISSLNMIMQAGGRLAIAGAVGQVREGFRVTQLDRVFRFYDDEPSAAASLG